MKRSKSETVSNFLVFSLLLITGVLLFRDQFAFGLNQDITRVLFYDKFFAPAASLRGLSFFIQPYSGQYLLMFLLNFIFGYDAKWYFIIGFIFRVIAAFSVYALGKTFLKNKFLSVAASFIFLVSYAGIQTSIPVCSPAYLSIALMNFGLIKLLKNFDDGRGKIIGKYIFQSYILIFLSFIIAPYSMHGLIFFIPSVIIFSIFFKNTKPIIAVGEIVFFAAVIYAIKIIGFTDTVGTAKEISGHLLNISYFSKMNDPIKALLIPFTSFYQIITIPEYNPIHKFIFQPILSRVDLNNVFTFAAFLIPGGFSIIVSAKNKNNKYYFYLLSLFWILFIFTVRQIFGSLLSTTGMFMFLGGVIVFLITNLIFIFAKLKKETAFFLSIFLVWPFCFSLIPHLAYPGNLQETTSRYLTLSTVGVIFLTIILIDLGSDFLIKMVKSQKYFDKISSNLLKNILIIVSMSVIFVTNFIYTRLYFQTQGNLGNFNKYIDHYFNVMNAAIGDRSQKNRPVVYLDLHDTDSTFVFVSVIDGGPERFSIMNDNLSENSMPFFITSKEQLVSIFCNNENRDFNPYVLKPGIDDLFAFKFDGQNISTESNYIREAILTISKNKNNCQKPIIFIPKAINH